MSTTNMSPELAAMTEAQRAKLPECRTWNTIQETCPETSTPRGGKCARADNSGYLRGVCAAGHIWDKSKETCQPMAKETALRHSKRKRYERKYA